MKVNDGPQEKSGSGFIDIYPQNPHVDVRLGLEARLDDKLDRNEIHADVILEGLEQLPLQNAGEQSSNRLMEATYRLSEYKYTVSETFVVVNKRPDPRFSVLLANSPVNQQAVTKKPSSFQATLFKKRKSS